METITKQRQISVDAQHPNKFHCPCSCPETPTKSPTCSYGSHTNATESEHFCYSRLSLLLSRPFAWNTVAPQVADTDANTRRGCVVGLVLGVGLIRTRPAPNRLNGSVVVHTAVNVRGVRGQRTDVFADLDPRRSELQVHAISDFYSRWKIIAIWFIKNGAKLSPCQWLGTGAPYNASSRLSAVKQKSVNELIGLLGQPFHHFSFFWAVGVVEGEREWTPSPQIILGNAVSPNDTTGGADLLWRCLNCAKFGKLILRKIIDVFDTRCHTLKLICIKCDFG